MATRSDVTHSLALQNLQAYLLPTQAIGRRSAAHLRAHLLKRA